MAARQLHRAVGLVLLLPLLGWAVTGAIFFVKPGYAGAYESLAVKTHPIDAPLSVANAPGWLEVRYMRTVLGDHLLARTSRGWEHVDPRTLTAKAVPSADDIRALMTDAFSANPERYGHIVALEGTTATTDTGVTVTLDWKRLSLSQHGRDTDRIDRIYKIHYLQWTGIPAVDRVLGVTGLVLLVALALLGVRLWLRRLP
jgi:PepSY-associated TM region